MPDPPRTRTWLLGGLAAVALGAGGAALWLAPDPAPPKEPVTGPSPAPTPTPTYPLVLEVGRVEEIAVGDRVDRRDVRAAAGSVRDTLTSLYTTAFVDPSRWVRGRFPYLGESFAGEARVESRRDIEDLTLGPTARRLEAVRPRRARVTMRILVGAEGRPISTIALMKFRATGLGATIGETSIRHRGRYVLRPVHGRWLVVAYDVRGRLGTGGR
jgi:hypothetical protein